VCCRYTLTKAPPWLAELLGGARPVGAIPPRYNIAPGTDVVILRAGGEAGRELALARWGLVPAWAKDPAFGARAINARSETAAEKPAFRAAMRYRRCLVPADGFYEWAGAGRRKRPHHIRLPGMAPFAFAGLWERWTAPDGGVLESCAILTTGANERLRPIHPRMPVILPREAYETWLDPALEKPGAVAGLLRPYPAEATEACPVGLRVNDVRNDDPACLAPAEEQAGEEKKAAPPSAQPSLFGE